MLAPSTYELIARAHAVAGRFYVRMRQAVATLPGNPGRITVDRIGPVWVARCDLPDAPAWMNLATPLWGEGAAFLDDVLAWYGDLRPLLEVVPQPGGEALARDLVRHGAAPTHMLDILRGPAGGPPSQHGVVDVAVVHRRDALLFARTLLGGHLEDYHPHEAEGIATLVGGDGVRCYLARIDGEPAAAAILAVDDGFAYLANASALRPFRNRGCHAALLATRLRDAADAGCEEVIALADVASTSHRNMERAGLHTLATVAQWTFPRGGAEAH